MTFSKGSLCDRLINEQIIPLHLHRTVVIVNHQKSKHICIILLPVYSIKVKGIGNWMLIQTNINHHFIVRLSSELVRAAVFGPRWSVQRERPISWSWMESSLKQFGVICHQSWQIPPELGIWGRRGQRDIEIVRERVGPLYYLSALLYE